MLRADLGSTFPSEEVDDFNAWMCGLRFSADGKIRNLDDVPEEFFHAIFLTGTSAQEFLDKLIEGKSLPVTIEFRKEH